MLHTPSTAVMDVGGSHVTAALIEWSASGPVVAERSDADIDPHGTAEQILSAIAGAGVALGAHDEWTLAFPGPFDYERGTGSFEGVGKFAAIAGLDLRQQFIERLGAARVEFVDDADAYGMGECLAGAARGYSRVVCVALGTGIGASFLVDGSALAQGEGVPPGGNLYPFGYHGQPIEHTVSTRALLAAYGHDGVSVREVFERARGGEQAAAAVVDETMRHLGRFLKPFLTAFRAEVLVVGGSISLSWDLIEPPLRRGLGSLPIDTVRSSLLADAPLIGAAAWARRRRVSD
jgi:glucokinase